MATNKTCPGVYIEEVPSGVKPIESASTSTAVFIGQTAEENAHIGEPKLIFRWADYIESFGFGIKEEIPSASGGVGLDAEEPGDDAEEPDDDAEDSDAEADASKPRTQISKSKADIMGLAVYNFFLNGGGAAYIVNVGEGTPADYDKAFASLQKIRDISIICLPGKAWGTGNSNATDRGIIEKAITHAEEMQNRMVIVDIAETVKLATKNDVTNEDTGLNPKPSMFSVAYYPWVEVANPFYKPNDEEDEEEEEEEPPPATFKMAPSSFVAGMWAKIDGRRGVWKAPAGVETALLGVVGLTDNVDDKVQGQLNPVGINCIRKIPGAGPVIWGSRTLATKTDPEWRYVPVRRTASMIEESIYTNIQWAVFEPNDHRLWSSLRVNINAFMNGLWRAGAFQGEKASDAYFVRCNLGDTMTQDDVDLGKVIVEVGFAPLKPAEFVIVRIQQKVAQQ